MEITWSLNSSQAAKAPTRAPGSASTNDSTNTDTTTAVPPKPIARNVAISRARASTAEYIVFSAPKTTPTAITPPMK